MITLWFIKFQRDCGASLIKHCQDLFSSSYIQRQCPSARCSYLNMLLFVLGTGLLTICVYNMIKILWNIKMISDIPSPKPLPILGHILSFRQPPGRTLHSFFQCYFLNSVFVNMFWVLEMIQCVQFRIEWLQRRYSRRSPNVPENVVQFTN